MKNIWLILCFAFAQLNAQIDLDANAVQDILKVDSKIIDAFGRVEKHEVSLIAADGEPFFARVTSSSMDGEELWLRQESDTTLSWNVYTIKKISGKIKRDLSMRYHKSKLEDQSYRETFIQKDQNLSRKVLAIDGNTTFTLPDSIYSLKRQNENGAETSYYKLHPSGDTTLLGRVLKSNDKVDHKGNWLEQRETIQRLLPNNSETEEMLRHSRKIRYRDSFELEPYFEIVPSLLQVNGQEMTYEDNEKAFEARKKAELEATGGSISYDTQYKIINQYFHKRYFSSEYLFEIELADVVEKKILEKRLFTDISLNVLNLHSQEFYAGRLHHNRWFDKSRSFQEMKANLSEKVDEVTKTGKTREVNGYECDEYKMVIDGQERFYYVTEALPFIDYFMSSYPFPGFVLRIEASFDQVGHVVFECDVKAVGYPAHYLELTKKGQEKLGIKFNYLSQRYK